MTLLGPNGLPINTAPGIIDIAPGTGGKLDVRETLVVQVTDRVRWRFVPGVYLVVAEVDFDRMVAEAAVRLPNV